jgi:hypothetical protein
MYATNGGTLFIVNYAGKVFGITCRHVFGGFNWKDLVVTEKRFGQIIADLNSIYYPTSPSGAAIDSDVLDILIVEFSKKVGTSFFIDPPYIMDTNTVCASEVGDQLLIYGAVKEKGNFIGPAIAPVFGVLAVRDLGASGVDPSLRMAGETFTHSDFGSITGFSGGPVFNESKRKICGMAVRGNLMEQTCKIHYLDIFDILEVLKAIVEGRSDTHYRKSVLIRAPKTSI